MTISAKTRTGVRRSIAVLALAGAAAALCGGAAIAQPYDGQGPSYYDQGPLSYDQGPNDAYTTGELTVIAPRVYGRSAIGAPIQQVSTSRVVYWRDLDLASPWGRDALRSRIRSAARSACDQLDFLYPDAVDNAGDCYTTAVRNGMYNANYVTGYAIAER
ncbi:MAG: UrcA family protein [Caulobacteraceae bacterium]